MIKIGDLVKQERNIDNINNNLKSLEGCPKYVGNFFDCSNNRITSLKGGPKVVIYSYYCNGNNIKNFKGFPEDYDSSENSSIHITSTPVEMLLNNIEYDKQGKFIYWCNEYDAITDGGTVIPERMEEVYNKLGLEYNED